VLDASPENKGIVYFPTRMSELRLTDFFDTVQVGDKKVNQACKNASLIKPVTLWTD
jgi:hypothetical protein